MRRPSQAEHVFLSESAFMRRAYREMANASHLCGWKRPQREKCSVVLRVLEHGLVEDVFGSSIVVVAMPMMRVPVVGPL